MEHSHVAHRPEMRPPENKFTPCTSAVLKGKTCHDYSDSFCSLTDDYSITPLSYNPSKALILLNVRQSSKTGPTICIDSQLRLLTGCVM